MNEHGSTGDAAVPLARRLAWLGEAAVAYFIVALLRLLPLDAASAFGGFVGRTFGPPLGINRKARRNLKLAFPDFDKAAVDRLIIEMWDNLGRTVGELPHLTKIRAGGPKPRIEIVGAEHIARLREISDRPRFFYSAHLGNWELAALLAHQLDLPLTLIYRQANNPYVERLIQNCRGAVGGDLIPKGRRAVPRIGEVMRSKGMLGILVDQKNNGGIAVPFFGHPAMTTPLPALCVLKYRALLFAVQVERLQGAHFRVTIVPPESIVGEGDVTIADITARINQSVEQWIRQRPGQWMWLHRRWPRDVAP